MNHINAVAETWVQSGSTVNTLTYTYDANSNMLTAADGDGTYTFTYDNLARVTTQKDPFSQTLTFTYDSNGNRTKVEDSHSGVTTSVYNAINLLTSRQFGGTGQTPLRIDVTYNAEGDRASLTRYSDLAGTTKIGETAYTYDNMGRLTNLQHKDGSANNLANYTYTYDAGSRVATKTKNSTTITYTHDATDQMTNDGSTTFTYDANGNRTMTGYATGTGNRMTNDGVYTYTYDDEGNVIKKSKGASDETWTFGYDHNNQMIWAEKRATDGGTLQMRSDYKYNAFSQRIEKAVDADGAGGGGTVTERFSYLGDDIWADLDGSNALQMRRLFLDGTDEPVARVNSSGTAAWYLPDRLGSIKDMTDNSGVVQQTVAYYGFGKVKSDSNAGYGDRYKYTARELDSETGLQLHGLRHYDPRTGR